MLEPSIYSISDRLKGPLESVDARGGLDEGRLWIVPDVNGEPGPHGVLRRSPGALPVSALQGHLGYVRVVEGVSDFPQNLPGGGLEVHGD